MDTCQETQTDRRTTLKRDTLGTIVLVDGALGPHIVRDTSTVSLPVAWLARRLMRRERAALEKAAGIGGIPAVCTFDGTRLTRSFLPGAAMHLARFEARPYFRDALRVLRQLHRRGVAHNDLAKEANWICMPGDCAGIVDFQLASVSRRRHRLFRLLAREDLRHLLKHKRHYAPLLLTARQRRLLEHPSALATFWRLACKPVYRFVTRTVLGWQDRPDARERQSRVSDVE